MKLLFLEDTPSSTHGGMELSLFDECCDLAARGHQITVGYTTPGDLIERYAEHGVRTVHLSRYSIDRRAPVRGMTSWALGMARALGTRPDAIIINAYYNSLFGGVFSRLARVPLLCHLRLMAPANICWQWRVMLPRVTRFIAVSGAVRDSYLASGVDPATVDVVHDGIDMTRFRPHEDRAAIRDSLGVPRDAFVVAFAGRIDQLKNIEALLRTFAALGLPASEARLLIAGRSVDESAVAYLETLRTLAVSLGIDGAVHWLGSRGDVPRIFSAADASGLFSRVEALARTTYESMACGTPAIAPRVGGMGEILSGEFARFMFDSGDERSAADLLRGLRDWRVTDPGLGDRARAHAVRHFSRSAMADGVLASVARARAGFPHARRGGGTFVASRPPAPGWSAG